MSLFFPTRGVALLIPSGPEDMRHLFFILTTADADKNHLLANISTWRQNTFFDDTCVLRQGDHDFIRAKSFVEYRFAKIQASAEIKKKVDAGEFIYKPPPSPDVLQKICDGVIKSPHTRLNIKNYYAQSLN